MMATETKYRPIIFSASMVRAILEGRKTMTRRVVAFKKHPNHTLLTAPEWARQGETIWLDPANPTGAVCSRCNPYGVPGDRLIVRESWASVTNAAGLECIAYRADDQWRAVLRDENGEGDPVGLGEICVPHRHASPRWRSPIHLRHCLSRITLEITGVRVERLQDIGEADAKAEGVEQIRYINQPFATGALQSRFSGEVSTYHDAMAQSWDTINAKRGFSWESNPWVWRLSFRRIDP